MVSEIIARIKFGQFESNRSETDMDILFVCKGWEDTDKSLYLTKWSKEFVKETGESLQDLQKWFLDVL